jgi:hypothetical protein
VQFSLVARAEKSLKQATRKLEKRVFRGSRRVEIIQTTIIYVAKITREISRELRSRPFQVCIENAKRHGKLAWVYHLAN